MLVRCSACRGAKKVIGLGGIERDCKNCKGAGVNSIEEELSNGMAKRTRKRTVKCVAGKAEEMAANASSDKSEE